MSETLIIILSLVTLAVGARVIVSEMGTLSKLLHASTFGLSLILLGFLTSLPELSVAINAQIDQMPQIYAGNLMGGSFLLLAGIIPLFTYLQNGLSLKKSLHGPSLLVFMTLLSLPLLAAVNGVITRGESVAMIALYVVFVAMAKPVSLTKLKQAKLSYATIAAKIFVIAVAAVGIYVACTELVTVTEAMALRLGAPAFLISFMLLSIGTNIPELTLALQAIFKKSSDVAFGDYVGSAAMNPLMLGVFSLYHGSYALGLEELSWFTAVFLGVNVLFLVFALSKDTLSKHEALGLLAIYIVVTALQILGVPQV